MAHFAQGRTPFAESLSRNAKINGRQAAQTIAFWFRRKYNLAPTDPRYLDATLEQMETEYWAHHYYENPAKEESEDDDFSLEAELRDADAIAASSDPNDWEDI
jgi:hypothetical protein